MCLGLRTEGEQLTYLKKLVRLPENLSDISNRKNLNNNDDIEILDFVSDSDE